MKKFTISIWGYGAEVTIGTLSEQDISIINSELSKESTLQDIVLDEKLGKSFYDIDDIYHNWGVGDKFVLSVTDESGHEVFQISDEELYSDEVDNFEFVDRYQTSTDPLLICVSGEKGSFFESVIECQQFDSSKLKLIVDQEVGITSYFYGDMISKVIYDGEELDNIGGSTDGKYFDVSSNILDN